MFCRGEIIKMIIPILAFLLIYINIKRLILKGDLAKGNTYCTLPYALTFFFGILFLITEVLSMWEVITYNSLFFSWGTVLLINMVIVFAGWRKRSESINVNVLMIKEKLLNVPFLLFLTFTAVMLILAYRTIPYNWDSMAYHLPRVVEWAQNRSVKHYAAGYMMQITAPVFAEYIQLHVYILAHNTDRFMTMVQCMSYLISAILVYQIAIKVGCEKRWAYISAYMFISLPIAFSEALNTQNDLIATVFLLTFVQLLLHYIENSDFIEVRKQGIVHTFLMGLCMGLAFLTKYYVAFIFVFSIIWLLCVAYKNKIKLKTVVISVMIASLPFFITFFPESLRLAQTFGSLFANDVSSGQMVSTIDPRLLFICFIKNLAFNFSGHYIYKSKEMVEKAVAVIAGFLHVDIVDSRISKYDFYALNEPFDYNHDRANATLLCILFTIALVIGIIILIRKKHDKSAFGYVTISFISFITFLTLMKFTTHRTRYEICFFALLCPAVCIIFQKHLTEWAQIAFRSVICFLCICEVISLYIYHRDMGNVSQSYGYFALQPYTYESYIHAIERIKESGYCTVGVINNDGYFEYPIWAMTQDYVNRIECVNVENKTSVHENIDFYPDCVLYIGPESIGDEGIRCHGIDYTIVDSYNDGYAWYAIAEK